MPPISLRMGDKSISPSESVRNLEVVFDSTMYNVQPSEIALFKPEISTAPQLQDTQIS